MQSGWFPRPPSNRVRRYGWKQLGNTIQVIPYCNIDDSLKSDQSKAILIKQPFKKQTAGLHSKGREGAYPPYPMMQVRDPRTERMFAECTETQDERKKPACLHVAPFPISDKSQPKGQEVSTSVNQLPRCLPSPGKKPLSSPSWTCPSDSLACGFPQNSGDSISFTSLQDILVKSIYMMKLLCSLNVPLKAILYTYIKDEQIHKNTSNMFTF